MSRVSQLVLGVCFLLLIVTWVIPELGLWEHSSGYYTFAVFVSLMVVGIAVIAYLDIWADNKRREEVVRARISDFQKRNFALHSEEIMTLSSKDVSSLRVYKIIILSILGGIGLMALLIIPIMSMDNMVKLAAAGGTIIILLVISLAINKRMDQMFETEKKTIIRGVVTKKNIGVDDDDDKAYHWVHIGERKVKVELELYMTYDIGNVVEFHVYERFGTFILHHEKVEGAGIEAD